MSLLKYVAYLLSTILIVECTTFRSDYHFDNNTKMWFKLHKVKRSWHDARVMCELEGATLLSPDDESLKQAFQALTHNRGIKQLYVGIHSTFAKGVWQSLDGKPLSNYEDLFVYNLDSSENQCAVLDCWSNFLEGVNCSLQYSFVCYKRDVDVTEQTICGTTDKAYTLDTRTGNCYKFHSDVQTWRDAYEICYAEGAYVTVIDDITEAEVISDIFKKHHETCRREKSPCKDGSYIGIVDWRQNKEWYTIKGIPIKKSGYTNWTSGEPNNANGDKFCVIVYYNGKFEDVSCNIRTAFICEKEVQNKSS